MDNPVKLEILLPAQAELEEIARVHMALSGPQSARSVTNEIPWSSFSSSRCPGRRCATLSSAPEAIAQFLHINI